MAAMYIKQFHSIFVIASITFISVLNATDIPKSMQELVPSTSIDNADLINVQYEFDGLERMTYQPDQSIFKVKTEDTLGRELRMCLENDQ